MTADPLATAPLEDDREAAADNAALAAAERGEFVEHAAVRDWLLSKNTASPKPRPEPRR